jgi:ADP-heptose:LPS heptosyltransferase
MQFRLPARTGNWSRFSSGASGHTHMRLPPRADSGVDSRHDKPDRLLCISLDILRRTGLYSRVIVSIDRKSRNVLLVQLADIGDLVLAAPAIGHLRQRSPDSHFTLLTKPSNVPLAHDLADDVLFIDKHLYDRPSGLLRLDPVIRLAGLAWKLRRRRFDEVIILHHLVTLWGTFKFAFLTLSTGAPKRVGLDNGRGWFLTDTIQDHGFGAQPEREYWSLLAGGSEPFVPSGSADGTVALLEASGIRGPYFVVHPGSGLYSTARRWPLEKFDSVIRSATQELALTCLVVGGENETELGAALEASDPHMVVNLCGRTDFRALMSVLTGARFFIGNDGGVAQLASTLNVPSVVVYGPTSPKTWGPFSDKSRAVRRDIPCSPCFYRYGGLGTPQGCATRECLVDLEPEVVARTVFDLVRVAGAA